MTWIFTHLVMTALSVQIPERRDLSVEIARAMYSWRLSINYKSYSLRHTHPTILGSHLLTKENKNPLRQALTSFTFALTWYFYLRNNMWCKAHLIDLSSLRLFRANETNHWNKLNRLRIPNRFLVSQETVVLCRWERETCKFGFIKRDDKAPITTVKNLESWRFDG